MIRLIPKESVVQIDFYQLIENSSSATVLLDGKTILYANKAFVKLLQLNDSNQIIGKDFNYLHPDYHSICEKRIKRVIEHQEIAELSEQKLILDNKEEIDVEVVAVPFISDGRVLVQANYQDITERKQAQQLLIQSEKLSVLGKLAAGILHEIRNPLTSIKGFLQLMMTGTIKVKEYLTIVNSEVDRIEEIANELLFFAKPKEEHFEEIDINLITKDAIFLWETDALKKNILIKLQSNKENIMIMGNKNQLKQVIINLIKNSMDAIEKGGNINIILELKNNKVCIIIQDNGIGIPKEKLEKLGQSFFTTKEKGTGLGLMVTYNIIKNHKGEILVESEQNIGTTFTIVLPHSTLS